MSLVKRGNYYYYDFWLKGTRFQASTRTANRLIAAQIEEHVKNLELEKINNRTRAAIALRSRPKREPVRNPRKQGRAPEGPGWIYIIRIIGGPTKIGLAVKDPVRRTNGIASQVPVPTEVLGYMQCDEVAAKERELHRRFDDKCVKGEWFNLSQGDINALLREFPFVQRIEPSFERLKEVMKRAEEYSKKLRGEA